MAKWLRRHSYQLLIVGSNPTAPTNKGEIMSKSLKKAKRDLEIRIRDYEKNFSSDKGYTKPGSMKK